MLVREHLEFFPEFFLSTKIAHAFVVFSLGKTKIMNKTKKKRKKLSITEETNIINSNIEQREQEYERVYVYLMSTLK